MAEVNIINVEVTPQAPINVETQTKSVNVQVGNDAALGAVTQGVIDLHKKVDDLANKQVDVDLTSVAKETTLNSAKEEILTAVEKGAQESTLLAESEAIKQAIAAGSGSGITLATEEEYSSFKDEMQTKINDILSKGL